MLAKFCPLEKFYLITGRELREIPFSPRHENHGGYVNKSSNGSNGSISSTYNSGSACNHGGTGSNGSTGSASSTDGTSPRTGSNTTPATPSTPSDRMSSNLGKDYLDVIFQVHGKSLKHLLLPPQWRLTSDDIARLVRFCPNLEQLGCGVEIANFNTLRLLIPFMPKLHAIRILDHPDNLTLTEELSSQGDEIQEERIGTETWKNEWDTLKWVGLGSLVFEICQKAPIEIVEDDGSTRYRKMVRRRPLECVRDVEIWSMDKLEI